MPSVFLRTRHATLGELDGKCLNIDYSPFAGTGFPARVTIPDRL